MQEVAYALGVLSGLILVLIALFLWAAVAGPIQEWLCEVFLDPLHNLRCPRKEKPQQVPYPDPTQLIVLISDVHLDTWDQMPSKVGAFAEFLQHVKYRGVPELYINGDLLDIPPHPLNQRDIRTLSVDYTGADKYTDLEKGKPLGVLLEPYDSTFVALNALIKKASDPPETVVTYLTGNHDIGIEGLRFIRPALDWTSIRVAWNPAVMLKLQPDRWVYVEHGHHYDPLLWLYLQYAVLQLLRAPGSVSAAQREGKLGMGQNAAGNRAAVQARVFPWELLPKNGKSPLKGTPYKEGFFAKLAKYRFRQAARRVYRRLWLQGQRNVRVVTFGHTHIPDRYEFPYGHLYVNSGDWAGNEDHQCYLLIDRQGQVTGPHQWRDASTAAF